MEKDKLQEAMSYLDPQLIQEAAQPIVYKRTKLRSMLLAACLILVIVIPVVAVTGGLLVEHYYGETIPDYLSKQDLDTYFRVNTVDKVPISSISQKALDAAAAQANTSGYYGFTTWDEAEEFLGLNILDSSLMQSGVPIPVTDAEGNQILNTPCHLTMLRNDDGLLYSINLAYFFNSCEIGLISLNVNAVTDQNPHDNNSSIGISNESAFVLQQTSEEYQIASGRQATIISTEYSDGHGWDIAGWTQQNGFVIRFSLSTSDQKSGQQAIQNLLDSIS